MIDDELFESAVRSGGDHAGVFEYDGDTGYFYLYETKAKGGHKVVAGIRVLTGAANFAQQDIAIRWNSAENAVGFFIRDRLWAAFDLQTGAKYGGNYRSDSEPEIPTEVNNVFKQR
jgi:hypothetical protein